MNKELKPFGLSKSLIVFGTAALILIIEKTYLIPYLVETIGIETIVVWSLVSTFLLFLQWFYCRTLLLNLKDFRLPRMYGKHVYVSRK